MKTNPSSITLKALAGEMGLGTMTVSRALSGRGSVAPETRRKVLEAARRRGYEPNPHARTLAQGRRDELIGIFAPTVFSGIGLERLTSMHRVLASRGFEVPIYTYGSVSSSESENEALLKMLCRQKPRAIVDLSVDATPATAKELARYVEGGGVLVSYRSPTQAPHCGDSVFLDYAGAAYSAVRHLIELGHRRIGFSLGNGHHYLSGFERALREAGTERRAEWEIDGLFLELGGAELAKRFLAMAERPTAWCIVNDASASAFGNGVLRAGVRVPHDVSVVGFDDTAVAQTAIVPLTTVRQPVQRIAEAVAQMLLSRFEQGNAKPPRIETICAELVVRESSAPPSVATSKLVTGQQAVPLLPQSLTPALANGWPEVKTYRPGGQP